jgi:hypothetical protein
MRKEKFRSTDFALIYSFLNLLSSTKVFFKIFKLKINVRHIFSSLTDFLGGLKLWAEVYYG